MKAVRIGCPIKYKRSIPGYCLSRRGWKFVCPTDLSEPAMLTMIIGAKVVEDIFPPPLNAQVKAAVDEILKGNNPDFLDSACVKSLKIFAESNAVEISELFPKVFEAWLRHRSLRITYCTLIPVEHIVCKISLTWLFPAALSRRKYSSFVSSFSSAQYTFF